MDKDKIGIIVLVVLILIALAILIFGIFYKEKISSFLSKEGNENNNQTDLGHIEEQNGDDSPETGTGSSGSGDSANPTSPPQLPA